MLPGEISIFGVFKKDVEGKKSCVLDVNKYILQQTQLHKTISKLVIEKQSANAHKKKPTMIGLIQLWTRKLIKQETSRNSFVFMYGKKQSSTPITLWMVFILFYG